jgi:hypothetical protein
MSNAYDQSPAHKYAAFTLIASHWYRVAYPDTDNRPMTRKDRVAFLLAEHYDSLAAQTIKPYCIDHHNHMLQEALSQYHNLYTLWRDNDFSPIMFASMTNSIRSTMSFPV